MLEGLMVMMVLSGQSAQANPPQLEVPLCEPVEGINDYDTDDIIWLRAEPYLGVVAITPYGSHLRALEADGDLAVHLFATPDGIRWPLLPSDHADVDALLALAEQAAACAGVPELRSAQRALHALFTAE